MNRHFSHEEEKMSQKTFKKFNILVSIEIQTKHWDSILLCKEWVSSIMKKQQKLVKLLRKGAFLHCSKTRTTSWNVEWRLLKKLKIEVVFTPAISTYHPSTYHPKRVKHVLYWYMHIHIYIITTHSSSILVAIYIAITSKWIKTIWYVYTILP